MRIDLNNATASQILSESTADSTKARDAVSSTAIQQEDRTTFSSQTQSLSSLVQTAMSSPEVRQDKVDSFKAAISDGTYELDPSQIASSMIDEHA